MDMSYKTPKEVLGILGSRLQAVRVDRGMTQASAAEKAGVSLRALQSLEAGSGSTLETFVRALKALGEINAIDTFAPAPVVSPLALLAAEEKRLRPRRVRRFRTNPKE